MELFFLLSLLLTNLLLTESNSMKDCLTQSTTEKVLKQGQSAELDCTVIDDCSNKKKAVQYKWFVFKEHSFHRVEMNGDHPLNFSLVGGSLHIKSLKVEDSGIYHCAAVWLGESLPGQQYVGPGTTLIVRGHVKPTVKHILLWLSFVLLSIYSLAVVSLIIKKHGCNQSICRGTEKADKTASVKKATKRRAQFRDVLEEMYNKKNLRRQKQAVERNKVEAASTDFEDDNDIYQNV